MDLVCGFHIDQEHSITCLSDPGAHHTSYSGNTYSHIYGIYGHTPAGPWYSRCVAAAVNCSTGCSGRRGERAGEQLLLVTSPGDMATRGDRDSLCGQGKTSASARGGKSARRKSSSSLYLLQVSFEIASTSTPVYTEYPTHTDILMIPSILAM